MTLIHNFEEDISVVVPAQYFLTFADKQTGCIYLSDLVTGCNHSTIRYSIEGDAASLLGFGINPSTGDVFRRTGLANLGIDTFNLRSAVVPCLYISVTNTTQCSCIVSCHLEDFSFQNVNFVGKREAAG